MVSAVVLVNTQVGEENRVLEDIKRLPIVEDVQVLWGVYDLMVRVKTNNVGALRETAMDFRGLSGVSNVLTLMIHNKNQKEGGLLEQQSTTV
ncbi:MAG: Lrp/AsnC ligand binding domain-containing protein [Methanocella sp.]|jgi:DNA-binding Lrp family transcriptional regulator